MATLSESATWVAGIYQLETTDPVLGGPDGIDNLQAKQLANRTLWLKSQVESLGVGTQPLDATLTALAGVTTEADRLIYANGFDSFAVTPLTAFIRTLLDDVDAATARATLGAAPVASPAFSGTPTAPTAAPGTNTQQLASTAFVQTAIAALVASSPATLDTLNELAEALGNDPNFATTMTTALGLKAPLASPEFTGNPTAPTPAQFSNDASLATTTFVTRALGSYSGYATIITSRSLVAADIGKALFVQAAGCTLTLPTPSSLGLLPGASLTIFSTGHGLTIVPGSGATINHVATPSVASIAMLSGQSITLTAVTGTAWQSLNSTCGLGQNADFGSPLAFNSYQRLPSGLIIQWGRISSPANYTAGVATPFSFPVAFPNTVFLVVGGNYGSNLAAVATQFSAVSNSQGQAVWSSNGVNAADRQAAYVAFGY